MKTYGYCRVFIAEQNELENIRTRRAEGIKVAR